MGYVFNLIMQYVLPYSIDVVLALWIWWISVLGVVKVAEYQYPDPWFISIQSSVGIFLLPKKG